MRVVPGGPILYRFGKTLIPVDDLALSRTGCGQLESPTIFGLVQVLHM